MSKEMRVVLIYGLINLLLLVIILIVMSYKFELRVRVKEIKVEGVSLGNRGCMYIQSIGDQLEIERLIKSSLGVLDFKGCYYILTFKRMRFRYKIISKCQNCWGDYEYEIEVIKGSESSDKCYLYKIPSNYLLREGGDCGCE